MPARLAEPCAAIAAELDRRGVPHRLSPSGRTIWAGDGERFAMATDGGWYVWGDASPMTAYGDHQAGDVAHHLATGTDRRAVGPAHSERSGTIPPDLP